MNQEELTANDRKIMEHLERAADLGVSLREYAAAYDVNLKMLADGKALLENRSCRNDKADQPTSSDFVRVTIANEAGSFDSSVCSIILAGGHTIQCHEWPPATCLQSLGSPAQ